MGKHRLQTDVEIRFIFDDCIGVFSDLAVENIICFAGSSFYSIFWTCTNAAAAANAFVVVNKCTFLCVFAFCTAAWFIFSSIINKADCVMRTVLATFSTGDTQSLIYICLPLLCISILPAREPHPIPRFLKSTAKTGGFMSLKMV